ncbi:MAG TPA: hypothetical protein VJM51_07075, partial [Dehalococcoidia bacterium]|nr:hypothetical protein [Dehalococcoidia bacterium]
MNWQHSKLLLRTIGAIALVMGLMLPMLPKTATPVAEAMNTVVANAPAGPDSAAISGAIYTTMPDGKTVNANHYDDPEDVYLSGGPRALNNKCVGGGLDDGLYYFMVTDPSGRTLLSYETVSKSGNNYTYTYDSDKRLVKVENGVMVGFAHPDGTLYTQAEDPDGAPLDNNTGSSGHRKVGTDPCWNLPLQLFPFNQTPNNGNVYKAWIVRKDDYLAANCTDPGN